jgi:hypothetical protein
MSFPDVELSSIDFREPDEERGIRRAPVPEELVSVVEQRRIPEMSEHVRAHENDFFPGGALS